MEQTIRGEIITFYSYKGGTGRTMALANTACLLAKQQMATGGKGVLMVDWDLEAPGLHRYFQKYLKADPSEGLIELFYELDKLLLKGDLGELSFLDADYESRSPQSEMIARRIIDTIDIDKYIATTNIPKLYLLKAGDLHTENLHQYGEQVNTFDWEELYNKNPHIIRVLAETLAEKYRYVLVDSRTGVTDVSGICTSLLPEKLVVVFTPNMQSLEGGISTIKKATSYRRESADLRPLMVYPLVSRVAAEEPSLRNLWRHGRNQPDHLFGFQGIFEQALAEIYDRPTLSLQRYFDEIQIQHVPRFAYGEEIAVLEENVDDRLSMKRSYETFVNRLTRAGVPWEYEIDQRQRTCFVSMPYGIKTDYRTGRQLDFDKVYQLLIKPVVTQKGIKCVRADEIVHSGMIDVPMFELLLTADLVIADISIANPNTLYELGIRHSFRPNMTVIISEDGQPYLFDINHMAILSYEHQGRDIGYTEAIRFREVLSRYIDNILEGNGIDSPVYTYLPNLVPPSLATTANR